MEFLACGDTGLAIRIGDTVDRETTNCVLALKARVDAAQIPGVVETVPTYLSLLVHYDPLVASQAELIEAVRALDAADAGSAAAEGRAWSLPVCFEGADFAPDLAHVAEWAGLSEAEVVGDVTGADQVVYMIGFAPGQPYCGDLPDRIALPRRKDPVLGVPVGSVVIATGKTVIYPSSNPTGWHIIGRTPIPLFHAAPEPAALLRAGDALRLRAVSRAEFDAIASRIAEGRSTPEDEARA